jgi:hypothetical protein
MTSRLSDRLKSTRDAFKQHVHGGKKFSSDEIIGLVGRLDELVAIALSQEREMSRHQWNAAALMEKRIAEAGNVYLFPNVPRQEPQPPRGGGAA